VKLDLGVPPSAEASALGVRLARLTLLRLAFLSVLLGIVGRWYVRELGLHAFSVQVALLALAGAFALAAAYAVVLRGGRRLAQLAYAQLVFDQLTWTVVVYLSGGAASGATSLYGLTALTGAILLGLPAATFAAIVGFACYGALCLLMAARVLPVPPDQSAGHYAIGLSEIASPVGLNLLVLVVVTLLAGYLDERLRLAGGKLEEATARAARAERLAALGTIAAGLAHEIRNPLGSISASVELLRDARGLTEEDRRLCEIIGKESARLNDLVGDMLDLAKPRKPDLGPADAASIAKEVVVLAARTGRGAEDVRVVFEGPEQPQGEPIQVVADPGQLRQLVWNLVRNGLQAAVPGTDVTVRVNRTSDGTVTIDVADRGAGVPPSTRDSLFDAFYTTHSHGAGLGLAVVKRIIDDHRWSIEVLERQGGGTVFRVAIPGGARGG
jgi:signal transduction histidine kinase